MNRLMTRTAGALALGLALLAAPLVVQAGDGPDPAQMSARLVEGLGVSPATADEIAVIATAAQEEGEGLRLDAATQAEALKAALDAGDVAGMEAAMLELERIQGDAHALQQATRGDIQALLTPEQRAKFTLFHLHKRHKAEQMMHHMQALQELQAPPRRDQVPHFDGG